MIAPVRTAFLVLAAVAPIGVRTGAQTGDVPTDAKAISGVVLNKGQTPEAGVWVIAETDSLPTPFRRMVVTDDRGRFLVPDLLDASYYVWVRVERLEARQGCSRPIDGTAARGARRKTDEGSDVHVQGQLRADS